MSSPSCSKTLPMPTPTPPPLAVPVMRQVGHASSEISQRYNHPLRQAHLAAAGQAAALVAKAGSGS
jgi:hypothetical protein